MAFGDSRKTVAGAATNPDGSAIVRDPWPFMDMGQGKRVFRLLPDPDGDVNTPADEVVAYSLWLPTVRRGDNVKSVRVFTDWSIKASLPEELAKKVQKRFFINVYDRTPVIRQESYVLYPDHDRKYWKGTKANRTEVTEKPAPNNSIMILEGSLGGNKSLMAEIMSLYGDVQNNDGDVLPMTAFDIELSTRGTQLDKVTKAFGGINREPLTQKIITLPRYDLVSWTRAWPNDAILEILGGADFDEVVKNYGIQLYVKKLITDEDMPF